eukprot:13709219-Heterocapsa_arctica.AAC.1
MRVSWRRLGMPDFHPLKGGCLAMYSVIPEPLRKGAASVGLRTKSSGRPARSKIQAVMEVGQFTLQSLVVDIPSSGDEVGGDVRLRRRVGEHAAVGVLTGRGELLRYPSPDIGSMRG